MCTVSFTFSATYLASILLLQTIAVFLTVIYIDMYHTPENKPVPNWLQSLARHVLRPLACQGCKARSSQSRVSPQTTDMTEYDDEYGHKAGNKNLETKSNFEDDGTWTTQPDDGNTFSWKEIVLLLDKATMYIYLVLITTGSLSLVGLLLGHHMSS